MSSQWREMRLDWDMEIYGMDMLYCKENEKTKNGGWNRMTGMMDGNNVFWLIAALLVITGIIIVSVIATGMTVYLVARRLWQKNRMEDYPLMLLRERLAKGEIDLDEYAEKKKWLKRY